MEERSSQMDDSIDNSFYESSIEEGVIIPEEYLSEKVVVSYESTFKDIYGDDVNLYDATYNQTDDTVTYQGKTFSWDYVEEMAMNHMLNNF